MNVLKKINRLRLEKGWSVYRLSVESGLPQSTITNMFNRETLPSISTLESICSALGVTLSEFFYEEDGSQENVEEFLMLYRGLPERTQQAILNLLRELS